MIFDNPQTWPVIRNFRELKHDLDRTLAFWAIGIDMTVAFIIDDFLADDPDTVMYLWWLRDSLSQTTEVVAELQVRCDIITMEY